MLRPLRNTRCVDGDLEVVRDETDGEVTVISDGVNDLRTDADPGELMIVLAGLIVHRPCVTVFIVAHLASLRR